MQAADEKLPINESGPYVQISKATTRQHYILDTNLSKEVCPAVLLEGRDGDV